MQWLILQSGMSKHLIDSITVQIIQLIKIKLLRTHVIKMHIQWIKRVKQEPSLHQTWTLEGYDNSKENELLVRRHLRGATFRGLLRYKKLRINSVHGFHRSFYRSLPQSWDLDSTLHSIVLYGRLTWSFTTLLTLDSKHLRPTRVDWILSRAFHSPLDTHKDDSETSETWPHP